jgi:hypothetical protein
MIKKLFFFRQSSFTCISKIGFWIFSFLFMYVIQHCFICRPSDSTLSEDAGIELRSVATLASTARRSNQSARFVHKINISRNSSVLISKKQLSQLSHREKSRKVKKPTCQQRLRIPIHFIRIRIQHFRLNTNTDPGL